ncbi:MAG: hypothetical protein GX087_11335 [Desulfobulbaceae bacterium]|nr:hypothetical protein [Desulfobulbaceae bacterium]
MYNENELCDKIRVLYPDIGACGIDIDVHFDDAQKTWIVHLQKDNHSLKHHLEQVDADKCMEGTQCVALGLDIAQLRKNIEGEQF